MSDSALLRKANGTICLILTFVFLTLGLLSFWVVLHFVSSLCRSFFAFFIPAFLFLFAFALASVDTFQQFVEAGECIEQEERNEEDCKEKNKGEKTERIRDFTILQAYAKLQKISGILLFIIALVLYAGVILLDLILFSKNPYYLFLLFPESVLYFFICLLVRTACNKFIETGIYLEKSRIGKDNRN